MKLTHGTALSRDGIPICCKRMPFWYQFLFGLSASPPNVWDFVEF